MNNLLEKARTGRTQALKGRPEEVQAAPFILKNKLTVKSTLEANPIPFISSRAQNNAPVWLH